MHEGFYAIAFQVGENVGHGVLHLNEGRLRGGDSILYYLGDYTLDGDRITAQIKTDAHAKIPGMRAMFGRDVIHLTLEGVFDGEDAKLTGSAREAPAVKFVASLKKIASR
jgi:hypothetical protein